MATTLSAQQAAEKLLKLEDGLMRSRAIAEALLDRGWVTSRARSPVESIAQTIEKNIREGVYNQPKLVFVYRRGQRLIGLPGMESGEEEPSPQAKQSEAKRRVTIAIPADLARRIDLARQAQVGESLEATILELIDVGLRESAHSIREKILEQVDQLTSSST